MFWKLLNLFLAPLLKLRGNKGLLPNKPDYRDLESELGLVFSRYTTKQSELSRFKYQYNQAPINICSFAGTTLAVSEQIGERLSIKFMVKLAVREGMVTGDGFSYQRACFKLLKQYGAIPYELMPDEVNESWEEYSKWTPECEQLLQVAAQYKISSYEKLRNESAILEALDNGYVVATASKWYQDMFNPFAPNFFLKMTGFPVGGHAYRITGYRKNGEDFETPQTFGANYGDSGKAWSETTLGMKYYDNWICQFKGKPTLN